MKDYFLTTPCVCCQGEAFQAILAGIFDDYNRINPPMLIDKYQKQRLAKFDIEATAFKDAKVLCSKKPIEHLT